MSDKVKGPRATSPTLSKSTARPQTSGSRSQYEYEPEAQDYVEAILICYRFEKYEDVMELEDIVATPIEGNQCLYTIPREKNLFQRLFEFTRPRPLKL
jgi:hypothetical protein